MNKKHNKKYKGFKYFCIMSYLKFVQLICENLYQKNSIHLDISQEKDQASTQY